MDEQAGVLQEVARPAALEDLGKPVQRPLGLDILAPVARLRAVGLLVRVRVRLRVRVRVRVRTSIRVRVRVRVSFVRSGSFAEDPEAAGASLQPRPTQEPPSLAPAAAAPRSAISASRSAISADTWLG